MIGLSHVTQYYGVRPVLADVSCRLEAGEKVGARQKQSGRAKEREERK